MLLDRIKKFFLLFQDRRRKWELAVGFIVLALMSLVACTRALDGFENLFLDMRFKMRGAKPFPSNIHLIIVDEQSLDAFGRWPWPRSIHARLLDVLTHQDFRPDVIACDFLFENSDNENKAGDEALVASAQKMERKIIMAYFFEKGRGATYEKDPVKEKRLEDFALPPSSEMPENLDEADKVSIPFIELANASQLAFVNTPVDSDGRTRRARLLMRYQGRVYPSMDLLTVLSHWGASVKDMSLERRAIVIEKTKSGRKKIPISAQGDMMINYYGGLDKISSHSYAEILKPNQPQVLNDLEDKIVVAGVTALGLGDRRATSFQKYETGISLHAQVIANILAGDFMSRAPASVSYAALFLVGFFIILTTMFLPIHKSLPVMLWVCGLYFLMINLFFLKGVWVDVAIQEISIIVIFIAITSFRYFTALEELKRTQEQLIQSAKMASLGQLSAGIAHEFRNILNAIHLNIECFSQPGITPERIEKYAGMSKRIMANATLILEGLLTFARKSESVKKSGNLKKTVEDTLFLVEKEMMAHQIEIETHLEDVTEISYDHGQISQVVMNLMNNARDALRERDEKKITLMLKNDGKYLVLDIADNGSGIPPQVLKRLFEPFVTSKPAGKGTGLGLSVFHGIIRNHGGDIKVTTAQGKGTTWHIFLPKD